MESVEAKAGVGIVGDRHAGNVARQLTIQSVTELAQAEQNLGRPIPADRTRRNITIDAGALPRVRGQQLQIGQVSLEVFADAAPCSLMEELFGPGARKALKRLAGIHCRVLSSGAIQIGDRLRAVDPDEH